MGKSRDLNGHNMTPHCAPEPYIEVERDYIWILIRAFSISSRKFQGHCNDSKIHRATVQLKNYMNSLESPPERGVGLFLHYKGSLLQWLPAHNLASTIPF